MDEEQIEQFFVGIKTKINQEGFDGAIFQLDKFLREYPDNEYAYYYRGVCLFAKEDYSESIKNYIKAIKLNPVFAKAYFNLGISYFGVKYYDWALINIGKALVLFSKFNEQENKRRCINALKTIEDRRVYES